MIIINQGHIGMGKTLSQTRDIVKALDNGYMVFSNYHVNWSGLYRTSFLKFLNKIISNRFVINYYNSRINYYDKQYYNYSIDYQEQMKIYESTSSFKKDPTRLWSNAYKSKKLFDKFSLQLEKIQNGLFDITFFPPNNIRYYESIETVFAQIEEIRKDPQQMKKIKGFVVAVDEAQNYFSSQEWRKIPLKVKQTITQSRKKGIDIYLTVQRPMALLNDLRFNSAYFIECKKSRLIPGLFIKNYYHCGRSAEAIPDLEEKPYKRDIFFGFMWYHYYDTMQEIETIEQYLN